MTREIQFRGLTPSGKWLFGDRVRRDGKVYIFPPDGLDSIDAYEVRKGTVGQLVRMGDEHGPEIWEGDRIAGNDRENTGTISYANDCMIWVAVFDNGDTLALQDLNLGWFVVTGNIHEGQDNG